jgi:hypothetical protein
MTYFACRDAASQATIAILKGAARILSSGRSMANQWMIGVGLGKMHIC